MGFKGSPGFMAPEILKYVGTEACTEKVDVFSYGMFLYEMISLHFPFEKQNLMHSQIERLVIEGERPPLQNRVSWCCNRYSQTKISKKKQFLVENTRLYVSITPHWKVLRS